MFSTLQDTYFVTGLQAFSPAKATLSATTMKQEGSWTSVSENRNIASQFYLKKQVNGVFSAAEQS